MGRMYKIPPPALFGGPGAERRSASFVVAEGCQCQDPANLFKETIKTGLVQKGKGEIL